MSQEWKISAGLLALLLLTLAAGGGMAQSAETTQPGWSGDLFDRLESAAAEYNAEGGSDPGVVERELLRNARINLYVNDDTGAQAVYSLRLDDELYVTELRRGAFEDPTLRAETMKSTVDQIVAADDTKAEVRRAVLTHRIRLERPIAIPGGMEVWVGIEEAAVGVGSIMVVSVAGAKFGFTPILSGLRDVGHAVLAALQKVWNYLSGIGLGGIATLLTILEKIDLLEPVKKLIGGLLETVRGAVAAILSPLTESSAENDNEENQRQQ